MSLQISSQKEWLKIIDAGLDDLIPLHFSSKRESLVFLYSQVLIAYLQGQVGELSRILREWPHEKEDSVLFELSKLRLQIRERRFTSEFDRPLLQRLQECDEEDSQPSHNDQQWRGEIYFVLAMAHEVQNQDEIAKGYYFKAWQTLEEQGAKKKAIKSLLNYLAAESRIHPTRKLLGEYFHVYREAKKRKEPGVASQALLNISREYQLIGAYLAALRFCQRALTLLSKQSGTLSYYLALVHRCHLLCDMGRKEEAQVDFELASHAGFPEIQSALELLKHWLIDFDRRSEVRVKREKMTFTWRERLDQKKPRVGRKKIADYSEMENQLLEYLAEKPRTSRELMEHLYGAKIAHQAAENRLKNLLHRIRSKSPHLIHISQGYYAIADEEFREIDLKRGSKQK